MLRGSLESSAIPSTRCGADARRCQWAPASLLLKRPSGPALAYTVRGAWGSTASAYDDGHCGLSPSFADAQVCPPSMLLKTPAQPVVAYTVCEWRLSTRSAVTCM